MIAIVVLHNGQQLITDLREVREPNKDGSVNPEGELICFVFIAPLVIAYSEFLEDTQQYKISFEKWIPFSKDTQFKVPYDRIVAIGEPTNAVKDAYINQIYPNGIPQEVE